MLNLDKVEPHIGLDSIRFGCSTDDVRSVLGTPSAMRTDEFGDLHYEYHGKSIELTFWAEYEFKLGIIESSRSGANIEGQAIMGINENEALHFVRGSLLGNVSDRDCCEHEDGTIQSWMEVEPHDLCLWFESGELNEITWFCEWSREDDKPKWANGI